MKTIFIALTIHFALFAQSVFPPPSRLTCSNGTCTLPTGSNLSVGTMVLAGAGAALPATCSVGTLYFLAVAPIGTYQCTAANTWQQIGVAFSGDTFQRPDAASLGNNWVGSTWSISGAYASNAPTLGSELLTDPGLEATYTAGLVGTLELNTGSPTVSQSEDVHGGSKAQAYTGDVTAQYLTFVPRPSVTAGGWYQASIWGKRTSGTAKNTTLAMEDQKPEAFYNFITSATYSQYINVYRDVTATASSSVRTYGSGPFDAVIVDDGSLKPIALSTMFATRPASEGSRNGVVRAVVNVTQGVAGVVARLDSAANPQNFILAYAYPNAPNNALRLEMVKCVAGVYTVLIAGGGGTTVDSLSAPDPSKYLEIDFSGTSVSLYYGGVQVGTTQTVSDAGIINNTIHGMFAAGGSTIKSFFPVALP